MREPMSAFRSLVVAAALLAGCHSEGAANPGDAGPDAGDDTGPSPGDDGGDDASSADDASEAGPPPCVDFDGGAVPSDDCILLGACPLDCVQSTASAYACAAYDPTVGTYPSAFLLMADPVHVVDYLPDAGPWDAGAYVSCAPQSCVRWSLADHVEGGSAWAGDPCSIFDASADASFDWATATEAWACPAYEGFQPPIPGCFNAGVGQQLGGPGTGVAVNVVWCCPPAAADAGPEASTAEGGTLDGGAAD
jgi:hypothetical protein